MKSINYFKQIISTFNAIKKQHSNITIGKHLALALDGYDLFGISDKNFLKCLEDYQVRLDIPIPNDNIEDIIKEGMNLHDIYEEEE